MASPSLSCPNCGEPVSAADFQCPACELLLDPDAAVITEPSVVRALLAPPLRRPTSEIPSFPVAASSAPLGLGDESPSNVATALFLTPSADTVVPRVVAGLELAGSLHDLDAYVTSFVDGAKSVAEIARAARLGEIEVHAILRSLESREIVALEEAEATTAENAVPSVTRPAPAVATTQEPRRGPTSAAPPAARGAGAPPPASLPPAPRSSAPSNAPVLAPNPAPPIRRERPSFVVGTRTAEHMVRAAPPRPMPPPAPPKPPVAAPSSAPKSRPRPLEALTQSASVEKEENVLQRAISLERSGELDGAIHILKRGISRVKNPAPLYNKLALILISHKRNYEEAESLLRQALELDPDNRVYTQNLYKVVALSASRSNTGKKDVGGFLARLVRRK